jgi:quercetin dioxygenase-like cupin family protein
MAATQRADRARLRTSPDKETIRCRSPEAASRPRRGPADRFIGDVYIDAIAAPAGTSTFAAANVHFTSGARTAWHTQHAKAGPSRSSVPATASSSSRGSHWHGAAPDRLMVHIAMQQNDATGNPVAWGRHVSDEEYNAAPAT